MHAACLQQHSVRLSTVQQRPQQAHLRADRLCSSGSRRRLTRLPAQAAAAAVPWHAPRYTCGRCRRQLSATTDSSAQAVFAATVSSSRSSSSDAAASTGGSGGGMSVHGDPRQKDDKQQNQTTSKANGGTNSSPNGSTASQEWEEAWQDDDAWAEEEEEAEEEGEQAEDDEDGEADAEDDGLAAASFLQPSLPRQQQQAVMLEMLEEESSEGATLGLASAMLGCGLYGSLALGLGALVGMNVLQAFRWDVHDLGIGVLWALPAATMAVLLRLTPPPTAEAAAAAAAASSTSSSSSSSKAAGVADGRLQYDVFRDVTRMARNATLADELPFKVELPLTVSAAAAQQSDRIRPVSELSWQTVRRSFSFLQESLLRPWSCDVTPPSARVLSLIEQQLRLVTAEVWWRGLLTPGLAALLYSTWASAGTSDQSMFFYARLFGLLTPQTGLAAAAGLVLAARLPLLWLSAFPLVQYTRLSALDVSIVGQLTESDWLLRVQPSGAPAAATAAAGVGSRSSNRSSRSKAEPEMQLFGRLKQQQQQESGEAADKQQQQQQQQQSKDQLHAQVDELMAASAAFGLLGSSRSSSSRGAAMLAPAAAAAGDDATALEQRGAQLLSELLDVTKDLGGLAAAAGASSSSSGDSKTSSSGDSSKGSSDSSTRSSSRAVKRAVKAAAKAAAAAKLVMARLNNSPDQRYFVCHMVEVTDGDDEQSGSSSSSSDEDDEDDDLLFETGAAAFRRRLQERLAALAAEQRRQRWLDLTRGGSSAAAAATNSKRQQKQKKQQRRDDKAAAAADGSEQQPQQQAASSGKGDSLPHDVSSDSNKWQVLRKILDKAAAAIPRGRVRAQGWYAAANVPTAEDRFVRGLLLAYAVLEELAPVGAFVATGGNAAASVVATVFYNALSATVNDVAAQRARQAVRAGLGEYWLLTLLPLQPGYDEKSS